MDTLPLSKPMDSILEGGLEGASPFSSLDPPLSTYFNIKNYYKEALNMSEDRSTTKGQGLGILNFKFITVKFTLRLAKH